MEASTYGGVWSELQIKKCRHNPASLRLARDNRRSLDNSRMSSICTSSYTKICTVFMVIKTWTPAMGSPNMLLKCKQSHDYLLFPWDHLVFSNAQKHAHPPSIRNLAISREGISISCSSYRPQLQPLASVPASTCFSSSTGEPHTSSFSTPQSLQSFSFALTRSTTMNKASPTAMIPPSPSSTVPLPHIFLPSVFSSHALQRTVPGVLTGFL
jgi:hypothetical protein